MYKEIVSYGIIGDTTTSQERVKADEDKRVGYLSSILSGILTILEKQKRIF